MKICIVGKYPPIEGGVATRTYHFAHALARRGHQVHVVTNGREVRAPYRVFMRPQDWDRCEAAYDAGYVTLHWTAPADRSQFHIPMGSPVVSKLASLGARLCAENDIDVVFSFYMEPYAIAGHLIAGITGRPHVIKTAGSDVGRLWKHPQLAPLYDHVFRAARIVIAGGRVAAELEAIGVTPARIRADPGFSVPEDLFAPDGERLDVAELCAEAAALPDFAPLLWGRVRNDIPYLGVYGKLGRSKGSQALLAALARLVEGGRDAGLLVMGHGRPRGADDFRRHAEDLGLEDHVVQIPFLPNWRVPEFIRRCLAVCCLEQDFPIVVHAPIMPREVLACGACLVGSLEMIAKLPAAERMVSGYNCVAVADVNDTAALTRALAAIVDDPDRAPVVGARGRAYVVEAQETPSAVGRLEDILAAAAAGSGGDGADNVAEPQAAPRRPLWLTRLAIGAIGDDACAERPESGDGAADDMAWARGLHDRLAARVAAGEAARGPAAAAVRLDLLIAGAMADAPPEPRGGGDAARLTFRLDIAEWALGTGGIADLVPVPTAPHDIERFEYDVNALLKTGRSGRFPEDVPRRDSFVILRREVDAHRPPILVIDAQTACILALCDGRIPAGEIAARLRGADGGPTAAGILRRIEKLFALGLIGLAQPARLAAVG